MVVSQRRIGSLLCVMLGCSIVSVHAADEKDKDKNKPVVHPTAPAVVRTPSPPPRVNAPPSGGGNGGGQQNAYHPTNAVVAPRANVVNPSPVPHTNTIPQGGGYNANAVRSTNPGNPGGAVHSVNNGAGAATHTLNNGTSMPARSINNGAGGSFNPGGNAAASAPHNTVTTAPRVGTSTVAPGNPALTSHSMNNQGGNNPALNNAGHAPTAATSFGGRANTTNAGAPSNAVNTRNTGSLNPALTAHTPINAGAANAVPGRGATPIGGINNAATHSANSTLPLAGRSVGPQNAGAHFGAVTNPGARNLSSTGAGKPVYTAPTANAVASRGANNAAVLTQAGSQSVIGQVNTARGGMRGINAKPLPVGQVTTHPNGALTVKTTTAQYNVRAGGSVASYTAHGQTANFHPNGSIASVHTATMDIHHSPNGQRLVYGHQADHSLLVNTGRHSGYAERGVEFGGRSYVRRDYVYGHDHYSSYYSPYHYRGLVFAAFVATAIYVPAYYAWAYHPWGAPVAYHWGWNNSPWYGAYGGTYFSPYDSYPSAANWLTDYTIANTLESGYDERPEAYDEGAPGGLGVVYDGPADDTLMATAPTPITPELKDAIAREVSRQLELQQQAAASGNPDFSAIGGLQNALQPGQVFIVANSLNVMTPDDQSCGLTAGDILRLAAVPGDSDTDAVLSVASSKRSDCPAGANVEISLQNLQDMQNNLSAKIDSGLASLQKDQGRGGLPAAPTAALAPSRSVIPAAPDNGAADVQALLDSQWQQANQTETQIEQGVGAG